MQPRGFLERSIVREVTQMKGKIGTSIAAAVAGLTLTACGVSYVAVRVPPPPPLLVISKARFPEASLQLISVSY